MDQYQKRAVFGNINILKWNGKPKNVIILFLFGLILDR